MIPLPLIQLAISAFTSTDTPKEVVVDIAKDVKTRVFNKTNETGMAAISFIIYQLTQDPNNHIYQGMFLFCVFMMTIRDTAHKVIAALKEIKQP